MVPKLAWRDIWRNPRRTGLTIGSISIGLAGIVVFFGFMDGMNVQTLENNIRGETGHIKIYRKGYQKNPTPSLMIKRPEEIMERLSRVPHVVHLLRRVRGSGLVATDVKATGGRILGIDLMEEKGVSYYWRYVEKGRYFIGKGEVLIGEGMAKMLQVHIGDSVAVILQAADGSIGAENFRVGGIIGTGNPGLDNVLVIMGIRDAMELMVMDGGASEISIFLDSVENTDRVISIIKGILNPDRFEVVSWKEILTFLVDMIGLSEVFKYIPLMILIGVTSMGILNTILMSVTERTREFGVMMALGTGPGTIFGLIVTETLIITLIGILLGVSVGTTILLYLGEKGIDLSRWAQGVRTVPFHPTTIYPIIQAGSYYVAIGVVFFSALLSALYPALRASRLSPSQALRHL